MLVYCASTKKGTPIEVKEKKPAFTRIIFCLIPYISDPTFKRHLKRKAMKRFQPDQKNPTSLISYVPDSLKTRAQLDYITQFSNYLRSNRQEYLKRISNWELKDIEQAIRNYSRDFFSCCGKRRIVY